MAATLTTSSWNIAFDYSDYYERIATALENIAANSTATLTTLTNIAITLETISTSTTLNSLTDIVSSISLSLSDIAAISTSTLLAITDIASTSSVISKSLETITLASIVSAISSSPSGIVNIDAASSIAKGNAAFPISTFGKLPTYDYISTASTSSLAQFEATVGGNTGTWMYVSNVITGTIVTNMEVSVIDPVVTTSTQLNLIVRQIDGILGNTGTYELRYDTGFKVNLNKGNSPTFTATAVLNTGTETVISVSPFGDTTSGLFGTLINTLPKSI